MADLSRVVPQPMMPGAPQSAPRTSMADWIANLSNRAGRGVRNNLMDYQSMVTEPGNYLRGLATAVQNPRAAGNALVDHYGSMLSQGPLGWAEMAGEMVSPRTLIGGNALSRVPGAMSEMTAYHGTPHTFTPEPDAPLGKFKLEKIGTGEGAQAYGHGVYVAETPGVAKQYATMDHPSFGTDPRDAVTSLRQNWQTNINPRSLSEKEVRYLMKDYPELSPHLDNQDIVRNITRVVNGHEPGGTVTTEAIYAMRALDKQLPPKKKGNLYTVDLPDEHIAKMLDWDKPLSEQPASVKTRIESLLNSGKFDSASVKAIRDYDSPGSVIYKMMASDSKLAGEAMDAYPGSRSASEILKSSGIPGIRYLDGTSRTAGEGTRNFVVFDPAITKILKRE